MTITTLIPGRELRRNPRPVCDSPPGGFALESTMIFWEKSPNEWVNLERVRHVTYTRITVPDANPVKQFTGNAEPTFKHVLEIDLLEGEPIRSTDPAEITSLAKTLGIRDPISTQPREGSPGAAPSP